MKVRLSVFLPMANGCTEVRPFLAEADTSLQWFREHADELARRLLRRERMPVDSYTALNVEVVE